MNSAAVPNLSGPAGPWAYTVVVRDARREALLVTTVQRIAAGRYFEPVGYTFTVRDWCGAALQCVAGWSAPMAARFLAFMVKYYAPSSLQHEPTFRQITEAYEQAAEERVAPMTIQHGVFQWTRGEEQEEEEEVQEQERNNKRACCEEQEEDGERCCRRRRFEL